MLLALSIENAQYLTAAKAVFAFYTLWTLDLFYSIIPDFCLNVSTLQALALEYIIALYPFALILFSYLLIVLCDRKVSLKCDCVETVQKGVGET